MIYNTALKLSLEVSMPNLFAVAVAQSARKNFHFTIDGTQWGFPREPGVALPPRSIMLMTEGFQGPENRDPRQNAESYLRGSYERAFLVETTSNIEYDEAFPPFWPDEVRANEVFYPYRVPIRVIGVSENLHVSWLPDLGDALRRSHIGSSAPRLVDLSDADWRALEDRFGTTSRVPVTIPTSAPDDPAPAPTSRNYLQDSALRKAIEEYAVARATAYYETAGWTVEELGKPFDLRLTADGVERHVEVKGTQTEAGSVVLTVNEVIHASNWPTDLVIVSSIRVDRSADTPVCSGGRFNLIEDWVPSPEALQPQQYSYNVEWDKAKRNM